MEGGGGGEEISQSSRCSVGLSNKTGITGKKIGEERSDAALSPPQHHGVELRCKV